MKRSSLNPGDKPLRRKTPLRSVPMPPQHAAPREPRAPKPRKPSRSGAEKRTRQLVAERSGNLCEMCGRAWATNVHHLKNRSQGGRWCPSECIHLCGSGTTGCHGFATEHPKVAHDEGGWVRWRHEGPECPVLLARHGWVLLDADGGTTRGTPSTQMAA